jgi:hypothetical protein
MFSKNLQRGFNVKAVLLAQRAFAAFNAISRLTSGVIFSMRALALFFPPLRPIADMILEISD